jgi:hypothetical protein
MEHHLARFRVFVVCNLQVFERSATLFHVLEEIDVQRAACVTLERRLLLDDYDVR